MLNRLTGCSVRRPTQLGHRVEAGSPDVHRHHGHGHGRTPLDAGHTASPGHASTDGLFTTSLRKFAEQLSAPKSGNYSAGAASEQNGGQHCPVSHARSRPSCARVAGAATPAAPRPRSATSCAYDEDHERRDPIAGRAGCVLLGAVTIGGPFVAIPLGSLCGQGLHWLPDSRSMRCSAGPPEREARSLTCQAKVKWTKLDSLRWLGKQPGMWRSGKVHVLIVGAGIYVAPRAATRGRRRSTTDQHRPSTGRRDRRPYAETTARRRTPRTAPPR